jgi:hypothetical protein
MNHRNCRKYKYGSSYSTIVDAKPAETIVGNNLRRYLEVKEVSGYCCALSG